MSFSFEEVSKAWGETYDHTKPGCSVSTTWNVLTDTWRPSCGSCGIYGNFGTADVLEMLMQWRARKTTEKPSIKPCVCPMTAGGIRHEDGCEDRPSRRR